ncbi:uncharacterized protein PAC_12709 [Phialocephala subalpina]|uniref:Major facilitator superfamily (MFS) profile domain-containing protein n=1 Tax=Phialocephala subalpina TaxID=576137 RepID=A0A1L7XCR7_9HELO|nr:uncharacterized protein PAC_12709 [Phialocephala subalpina]
MSDETQLEPFVAQGAAEAQDFVEEDSTQNESSALIPKASSEEEPTSQKWSPGPGLVWIQIDFNAAITISWLTTAYLITSLAFRPLYGRFSDLLGRRACFFSATGTFRMGCLGCGLAPDIIFLNLMRALTGLGGGLGRPNRMEVVLPLPSPGLFGGLIIGYFVIVNPPPSETEVDGNLGEGKKSLWRQIDISGSILLAIGLSAQLTALSLGGNQYPWSDFTFIVSLVVSVVILIVFVVVEVKTKSLPIMPMWMLKDRTVLLNTISNILFGKTVFESRSSSKPVLLESASKAGMRLIIPSLATSIRATFTGL